PTAPPAVEAAAPPPAAPRLRVAVATPKAAPAGTSGPLRVPGSAAAPPSPAAADQVAQTAPTPPRPSIAQPAQPVRVQPPAAPSAAPAAAPALEAASVCLKHPGQLTTHRCLVCQKPICPKCMELFGFVCSAFCKSKAEDLRMDIPVYEHQKVVVEN